MTYQEVKRIFQELNRKTPTENLTAHNRSKPKRLCEPGACDCCQYIGEGDFLCDKHLEIVVSDWEPTANYLMCQTRNTAIGGDADEKET